MDPPLRERLLWRNASEDDVEAPATRVMMARTAALFAGAGAFVCLLGTFVPGEAQFDDDVLLVAAAVSALSPPTSGASVHRSTAPSCGHSRHVVSQ